MPERIFLIDDGNALRAMPETPFGNEDVFQAMLEDFPELLCGDHDSASARWLLVSREMPVADSADGADRWSLDHLFLDAEAIPTLVEVKRSTDTRIRREVVGQMLDYAANAVLYWPVERVRAEFEKRCELAGQDPVQVLAEFIEGSAVREPDDGVVDNFWSKVETNLKAEQIRLIFVADEIPSELARIIEFLNGQMTPAEVIGLELKQYASESIKTLVPRIIGRTVKASTRRTRKPPRDWDRPSFLAEVRHNAGDDSAELAERVMDWLEDVSETSWGKGASVGYFYGSLTYRGKQYAPLAIRTKPSIELGIWGLRDCPELHDVLDAWRTKLNTVQGIDLPPIDDFHHRQVDLGVLTDADAFKTFTDAWDELARSLRA